MGSLLAPRAGAQPSPSQVRRGSRGPISDGIRLFSYPLLVDDGRLSQRADRAEGRLGGRPFLEIHPEDAEALELVDGAEVTLRTASGEVGGAGSRQPRRASRRRVRAVQPAGLRRQHAAVWHRSARPSPSPAASRGCRGRRESRRELGRLGAAGGTGGCRVHGPACRRDALHLDGAQGRRRHADARRADARRTAGHPHHAGRRHQALLQGGHHADQRRSGRLRARSCSGDVPGLPCHLRHPVRNAGASLRTNPAVAAGRSEHRDPLGPGDDLDRCLRRGLGRLVQRLQLPTARIDPLQRSDDQLRGRDGPGAGRSNHVQRPRPKMSEIVVAQAGYVHPHIFGVPCRLSRAGTFGRCSRRSAST